MMDRIMVLMLGEKEGGYGVTVHSYQVSFWNNTNILILDYGDGHIILYIC